MADLLLDRFDIILSVSSVGHLLHRLGLTPLKPLRRAYERDDDAINRCKKEVYPNIKKASKQHNGEIFWLDEASIRSDDSLQRTWVLKGETL
ncbi:MAG: winged helix-turn-helix domain-containing protein [Acidiferrobacterales bacterium]|nr:winged helix-turn-helix domain-containing protein [Acidiferrobacterales bacterium]